MHEFVSAPPVDFKDTPAILDAAHSYRQEAESSKHRRERIEFREAQRQQRLHALQACRRRDEEAALQLEQRLAELAHKVRTPS